jgi:hypothetical protein
MTDAIAEIRAELTRLGATHPTVPQGDAIGVKDLGAGDAFLLGSPRGIDFRSATAAASEIIDSLRALPDNCGPERIRSEFA